MISSASSALPSIAAPVTPQNNTPSSDDSSSFSDVMQQQQQQQTPNSQTNQTPAHQPSAQLSSTSTNQTSSSATTSPTTDNSTSAPASTAPATSAPAKPTAAPVAAGSDLSAMIIQATVLASNLQPVPAAPSAPVAIDATSDTPQASGKVATPTADLSTLIAQATTLLAGTPVTTTAKISGTATTGTAKDPGTTMANDPSATTTATNPTDLSALMLQASMLGTGGAVTTGTNTPAPTIGKSVTSISAKEKKSATSEAGGSFLQSATSTSSTIAGALSFLNTLSNAAGNASINQTLTTGVSAKNTGATAFATGPNPFAGTANDEKAKDMNATLTTSAMDLLSSTGANQSASAAQPDLQIKLSSNVDFHDALKQVMHVANLTQTTEARTPMRVEMEIQTPPGAIVNIYVSKSGDGLRAQLSTNDPVALAWVQNQMNSLKNTGGLGVDVKWAPPQMETGPTITTSGSQDANLNWNQGGGQSPYQQPDERQQNPRQQPADEAEFATAGATTFMNSLTSAARAA